MTVRAIYLFVIPCSALLFYCSTAEKVEPMAAPPREIYYTLRNTNVQNHSAPLPTETNLIVEWTYSDGSVQVGQGFRGWDFDHNGKFEALESIDAEGITALWAYDFDEDGKIDAWQRADGALSENALSAQQILLQTSH